MAAAPLALKTSPAILHAPFTHAGGMFGLLFALYQARPIVLFERFEPLRWAEAVRRYKPKAASLVPTMIRMVLAADIPREALASLAAVRSGTGPLDPATQVAFEERYGIPVLIDYGAAEFIGGVAGWSMADYRRFAESKRGSAGRPRADVSLRVIDPQTHAPLATRQIGQLELKSDRFAPDWIRTMDLASLDEDGFLYIHGRMDDAINRGGFKVLPDEVAAVLRLFPGVVDVAVMGVPHERLGQAPVAVIEAPEGARPDVAELEAFARARLAPYQVPVAFRFVEALPRTSTMKISRPELRAAAGGLRVQRGLAPPPSARCAVCHLPRFTGEERCCATLLLPRAAGEGDREAVEGAQRPHKSRIQFPLNTGVRFSSRASTPSAWSSVRCEIAWAAADISRMVS